MAKGSPLTGVVVAVLAFLCILVFRLESTECARILHTAIPDDGICLPPPPKDPDHSKSSWFEGEPPPVASSSSFDSRHDQVEKSVASAAATGGAVTWSSKVVVNQQGFEMLPRGSQVPPVGIPSPIHN